MGCRCDGAGAGAGGRGVHGRWRIGWSRSSGRPVSAVGNRDGWSSRPAGGVWQHDPLVHLVPAQFADSSKLQVGQIVLAMGNPLGLASSATDGIISAVGRTVSEPAGSGSPGATLPDAIQTSAAINPGNSGGALVDLTGDVVGIPTLTAADPQLGGAAAGIGFAIPANIVTDVTRQIVKNGHVSNSHRAALGVPCRPSPGPMASPRALASRR